MAITHETIDKLRAKADGSGYSGVITMFVRRPLGADLYHYASERKIDVFVDPDPPQTIVAS